MWNWKNNHTAPDRGYDNISFFDNISRFAQDSHFRQQTYTKPRLYCVLASPLLCLANEKSLREVRVPQTEKRYPRKGRESGRTETDRQKDRHRQSSESEPVSLIPLTSACTRCPRASRTKQHLPQAGAPATVSSSSQKCPFDGQSPAQQRSATSRRRRATAFPGARQDADPQHSSHGTGGTSVYMHESEDATRSQNCHMSHGEDPFAELGKAKCSPKKKASRLQLQLSLACGGGFGPGIRLRLGGSSADIPDSNLGASS